MHAKAPALGFLAGLFARAEPAAPPHANRRAVEIATFLKAVGHEGRLMILCHLVAGEKSVGELEALLVQRQSSVSQQLARLRAEGLVETRRDGQTIYYKLADPKVAELLELLDRIFAGRA